MAPLPEVPLDVRQPLTYAQALAGLVDRPFLETERWQEQQRRAVRDGAHPDILEFERVFIRKMAKLGIPMFASEVMRSAKRQDELFALGTSRARGGQSAHQVGCAVDLVHSVKGWAMSKKEWELVLHTGREVAVAKGLKVENLADLTGGFDPAHWQLKDWKAIKGGYPEWPPKKKA